MRRALIIARRLAVCVVVAGLLGLPLALSWAVTHTEVTQQIGTSPTTFTLSTQGHSEVRLGIAGTVYLPISSGPVGVVATVDGPGDPGAGDGDLAAYVRPEMLQLYTGLFHDPEAAVDEYVSLVEDELRSQLFRATAFVAGLGGLALFALHELLPVRLTRGTRRDAVRIGLSGALVLAMSSGLAVVQLRGSDGGRGPTTGVYALSALDGTPAAGSTTDSPVLRALLGGAISRAQVLVDRQEADERSYRANAEAGLDDQQDLMVGPEEGELAVMMQSDMHCNTTMIRLQRRVFSMLSDTYGTDERPVPSLLAIAGDLTTNGTAAEGVCIRTEADISGDAPIAAISGNHESDVSEEQMGDAGMEVLDGSVVELGGFRLLGDGDPSRSELFGATRQRGDETQAGQGERLRGVAEDADDEPDLLVVHEGYAAQAFLGIDSVTRFLDEATGDLTTPVEDDVDDVPASAVFYGHWHNDREPRVVWNDDGTWTLVMELNTSGGAVDTPTINNFSTPWSSPQQVATFPVLFLDEDTRLVTGYQLYRFETDGTVTVEPRVEVGAAPTD
ncbi:metallophosphoesterase family protein [Nocardioides dongxiaopingii]|uniref:metallophosphoesterase family protein n=1 Tax=Nocardioides dongxiaopingii TaxID=2576036 RepID=UPI0010C7682C|nr:hypothetical protein [Nocardioides dongxiaopingii]